SSSVLSRGAPMGFTVEEDRGMLAEMFRAALAAADPAACVAAHLPDAPTGRTVAVGAGKASAAMARAFEAHWTCDLSEVIVTRHGYAVPGEHLDVIEAGHPIPDAIGRNAAELIKAAMSDLTEDDLVVALTSGGGSSLLALPAAGITLAHKQAITAQLLR